VLQIRSLGGAFAHRAQNFSLVSAAAPPRAEQLATVWRERVAPPTRTFKDRYDPAGVVDANLRLSPATQSGSGR
jgi:hypothetical protein